MRHLLLVLALAACHGGPHDSGGDTDTDDGVDAPTAVGCAPARWHAPPACGTGPITRPSLISDGSEEGADPALAAKASGHDRLFHALVASTTGVNSEVVVPLDDRAARDAVTALVASDAWTFDEVSTLHPEDVAERWTQVAGAYAGVGVAADAFRYGVLRDAGAPCVEVDRARRHLLDALVGLHRAVEITGAPGVIARGYGRLDDHGAAAGLELTPLFDDAGQPLPPEKDNGTWRADQSGAWPDYAWVDSCSRDQYVGWMAAFGAAWEVVRLDPTIPDDVRATLRADALALAESLRLVRPSGYDLEIVDADGRTTYHGLLHEQSLDRVYVPGAANGENALMALGSVAVLAMVSGDPAIDAWLNDELLGTRRLHEIARDRAQLVDFGLVSNFSGYNMDFLGGLLAGRYLCDAGAREAVAEAVDRGLYAIPGHDRQPSEQGQTLYDLTAVLARAGVSAWTGAEHPVDADALEHGLATLRAYPDAPFWDHEVVNCDEDEIAAGSCLAVDGTTTLPLADGLGRGDELVADVPVPMSLRPPSNYFWRSNPYAVNGGGDASVLLPAVDFRFAYWLGRWATTAPRD